MNAHFSNQLVTITGNAKMLLRLKNISHLTRNVSTSSGFRTVQVSRPAGQDTLSGQDQVKRFEDIPRPPGMDLPIVGDLLSLTKKHGFGQFWKNLIEYRKGIPDDIDMLRARLPNVNQDSGQVVFLFDPDDVEKVYRNEGKYPRRGGTLDAFKMIRESRPDIFGETPGVSVEEGERWLDFRKRVQQDLMRPKSAFYYINDIDQVSKEFVSYVRRNRDPDSFVLKELLTHLQRFSFEAITVVAIDTKMGTLKENPDPVLLHKLEVGEKFVHMFPILSLYTHIWSVLPKKLFPVYRQAMRLFDEFVDFVRDKVIEAERRIDAKADLLKDETEQEIEVSVLERMILRNGRSSKIPVVMAIDMIIAGSETTGNTGSFLLHHLARNKSKQEKLRDEILSFNKDVLSEKELGKMRYFHACLRESFRMTPTISGISRILPEDIILKGFRIPAGTLIMWSSDLLGREEKYFPEPDKFIPERWLDEEVSIPPTLVRQFSHGPRMCIGKRFAELELQLLIANVLQNFELEWVGSEDPIETVFVFSNVPDKDLLIKFIDRK